MHTISFSTRNYHYCFECHSTNFL